MNEEKLIALLGRHCQRVGMPFDFSDDCAFIPEVESLVVSKDLLVQDTHFILSKTSPTQLAKKALHVNLSDLASNLAVPRYVFLGLALPFDVDYLWIEEFVSTFIDECVKVNVQLKGGDTVRSKTMMISVTALGQCQRVAGTHRKGANPGDVIFVTGNLGNSRAGLDFLGHERMQNQFPSLWASHVEPRAHVAEAQELVKWGKVTALMDISDGLWLDLSKLCEASGVGACVHLTQLPVSTELKSYTPTSFNDYAVIGGEDYVLLGACRKDDLKTAPSFVVPVGEFTEGVDIFYKDDEGTLWLPKLKPFEHFSDPRDHG